MRNVQLLQCKIRPVHGIEPAISRAEYFKDIFIYSEILTEGLNELGTGDTLANKTEKNHYSPESNLRQRKRGKKYLYFKLERNEYSIEK